MTNWLRTEDWTTVKPGDKIRVERAGEIALEGIAYGYGGHPMRLELKAFAPELRWLESLGFTLYVEQTVPEHHHEKWMLQEHPDGGDYCAACGKKITNEGD